MNEAVAANKSLGMRALIACGNVLFKFRNGLFPMIFVVAFLGLKPAFFLNDPELDKIVTGIGVFIALLGAAVRLAVIGFAYIVRGGRNRKVYAEDLVTAGIYAHSRNPMYVGNILIAIGVGLIYGSVWMYFAVIPFFIFTYLAIVAAEENYLFGKFGPQYLEYCNDVPRFIPNLRGLRETLSGFKYDWKKVLRKDYGTLSSTLAGVVALLMWKMYCLYGYNAVAAQIFQLGLLLIPIGLFYFTIRHLKHAGKLESSLGAQH